MPHSDAGRLRSRCHSKDEPVDGLALALKIVTIHVRHHGWAATTFGRKWAVADRDPATAWDNKYAVEATIDQVAAARARVADANSFLYLAKELADDIALPGRHVRLTRTRARPAPSTHTASP
jgi:homoserine O-acetyltransferase